MPVLVTPLPEGLPGDLGRPQLPGSKSHTQRAMVLCAFTPGPWLVRGALRSLDTEVLAAALVQCGASVEWTADGVRVRGSERERIDARVDFGENGTALRMLLLVVPLLGGRLQATGAPGLRRRPVAPALVALQAAGARIEGEGLPLTVDGAGLQERLPPMAASLTTQAATGALLGLALRSARTGGTALLRVQRASAPGYLAVTAAVLRSFGWQVGEERHGDEQVFAVSGGPGPGGTIAVPVDPSSRALPMALAAMHGIDGAPVLPSADGDPHPDWAIDVDLAALRVHGTDLELTELQQRPDCVPALAAVAACRRGRTSLPHLPALRAKESDRLQAIAAGLAAAGAACRVVDDGLQVVGPLPRIPAVPRELPAVADHRIVMALSLLGTVLPRGVRIGNEHAVHKSWPAFFDWLARVASVTSGATGVPSHGG